MADSLVVRKSLRLTEREAHKESDTETQQRDYDLNIVKTLKKKS